MPLRDDRIHRYVNAFCPRLPRGATRPPAGRGARLSGWLAERDDRIWLERGCPDHGLVRTLYDESPEILTLPRAVDRADQGARARRRAATSSRCPSAYEDGLPEMQTQHTCILLEDLTRPLQPASARPASPSRRPARASVAPLGEVLASIDARLSRENGRIDVLMLSGGEPTLYPWLAELLDAVAARPIVRVLVNTNGLRIAQDDELLALLTRHRERVEVYLQYDGESRRGVGLPPRRRHPPVQGARASSGSPPPGVFTTLTMTAALGVNDDEIGAGHQARARTRRTSAA